MYTSDEGQSRFSSSDIDEPILDRSSSLHKDAGNRNTEDGQEVHQTKLANFDDAFAPQPPFSCLSLSFPYNGPISWY